MKEEKLSKAEKEKILQLCNSGLITDAEYNPEEEYPTDWFKKKFQYLKNEKLQGKIAEAYYESRFCWRLMETLRLPSLKCRAMVRTVIMQNVSICEALITECIIKFHKDEYEQRYKETFYTPQRNILSNDTKITKNGRDVSLCFQKEQKADLKYAKMEPKTEFAVEKGIISKELKDEIDDMYKVRNNVHILKASETDYIPKKSTAKETADLLEKVEQSIREYYTRTD